MPHCHDKKEVSVTDGFTAKGFADYIIEQRGHANTFLDRRW
jgi:hypothetical protein